MSEKFLEDILWIQTGENVEPSISNRPHEALQRNIGKVYSALVNRTEWIKDTEAVFNYISQTSFRVSGNLVNRYTPGRPIRAYFLATSEGSYVVNSVVGSAYSPVSDSTTVTVEIANLPEAMEWVEHHIISNLVGLIRDGGMLDELAAQVATEAVLSEWFVHDQFTYVNDMAFDLPGNRVAQFNTNRLIRIQRASNEMVYTYVTAVTFDPATNTTRVNVNDPQISTTIVSIGSYLLNPARIEDFLNRSTRIITMVNNIATLTSRLDSLGISEVAGLEGALSTINAEITSVNGLMTTLAATVSTLNDTIVSMESQVSTNTSNIGTLNTTVSGLATSVSSLSSEVSTLQGLVTNAVNLVNSLEAQVTALDTSVTSLSDAFNTFLEGGEELAGSPELIYSFGNYVIRFAANMGSNFVNSEETLIMKFSGNAGAIAFKSNGVSLDATDRTLIALPQETQNYIKTRLWESLAKTGGVTLVSVSRYLAPTKYTRMQDSRESSMNFVADSVYSKVVPQTVDRSHVYKSRAEFYAAQESISPALTTWLKVLNVNSQLAIAIKSYPTTSLAEVQVLTNGPAEAKAIQFMSAISEIVACGIDFIIARVDSTLYRITLSDTFFSSNPTLSETGRFGINLLSYSVDGPAASTSVSVGSSDKFSNIIHDFKFTYVPDSAIDGVIDVTAPLAFLMGNGGTWFLVAAVGDLSDNKLFVFPISINSDFDSANFSVSNIFINKNQDNSIESLMTGTFTYKEASFSTPANAVYGGIITPGLNCQFSLDPVGSLGSLDLLIVPAESWGVIEYTEGNSFVREYHVIRQAAERNYFAIKNYHSFGNILEETDIALTPAVSLKKRVIDNSVVLESVSNIIANLQSAITSLTAAQVAVAPIGGFESVTEVQTALDIALTQTSKIGHTHSYTSLSDIPQDISPEASPDFMSITLGRDTYTITNGTVPSANPNTVLKLAEVSTLINQLATGGTPGTSADIFITVNPESGGERDFSQVPVGWELGNSSELSILPSVIPVTAEDLVIHHDLPFGTGVFIDITELKSSPAVAFNYDLEAGAVITEESFTVIKDFYTRFDATSTIKIKVGVEG